MNKITIIKNLILNEVNKLDTKRHSKYKVKYTNEYYINMMMFLLKDINSWSFLKNISCYGNNKQNIPNFHYVTIKNKFYLWTRLSIFENAFKNYNNGYYNTNQLYIDATSIYNKKGHENVVINPENKKKKVTKLSIISNKKGLILSVIPFDIKNTINNKIKTAVHDVKMINKTLKDINHINNNSKNYYLIADKAYKSQEKYLLTNKPVKILTPDKKNSKYKNTKFINLKVKNRIIIEHCNMNIKRYERIMLRKDGNIKTYMSWVYIGSLLNNIMINIRSSL
jgi:hypothetical protein